VRRVEDPDRPPCGVCQEIHRNKGTEPPCFDCMPPLLRENTVLFEIYHLVANQVIVAGMGEVLDLNICAVEIALDRFEVPEELRIKYMLRLMSLFRARLLERKGEEHQDGG